MTSLDGRILAALDQVAHDDEHLNDQNRDTVWAVVAHVALNLVEYRPKGAVVATDSWLSLRTGFSPDRAGTAIRRAIALGALADETRTPMGDYVRDKAQPVSGFLSPDARVVTVGKVQDGGAKTGVASQDGGGPTFALPRERGQGGGGVLRMGEAKTGVEGQGGGQLVPRRGTLPGSVDEGAERTTESTGNGDDVSLSLAGVEEMNTPDVVRSERSAHSELPVRDWLMSIEVEAPVWRRPSNVPGVVVREATGPQGMRLYGTLLRYGHPVRPKELATEANIGVKKARSLLGSFKRCGLAQHTDDGWIVGPVRPSDVGNTTSADDNTPAPLDAQPPSQSQEATPDEYRPEDEWLDLLDTTPETDTGEPEPVHDPITFSEETDDEHAWTAADEAAAQERIRELLAVLQ